VITKVTESTGQDDAIIYEVSAGVEPMYLSSEDGTEEEINPHSFIDPNIGIIMTENIKNALIEISPENEEAIEENAKAYLTTLEEMDEQYQTRIDEIPEGERVLEIGRAHDSTPMQLR